MNTIDFFKTIYEWELADIAHVMITCAAICALTPTPKPGTLASRLYKVVEFGGLIVFRAKSTGVTPAMLAQEVAPLLMQHLSKSLGASAEHGQPATPAVQPAKE